MRRKTIVASLLCVIMLGLGNTAIAYTIEFSVQSVNNSDDTATFTISDPLQALAVIEEGVYGGMFSAPATFNATGEWAAYAPEVALAAGVVGFQKTGDSWTPILLWINAYDSGSNGVMSSALTDSGIAILLLGGGITTDFLISPDPGTVGQYRLFEMLDEADKVDLETPLFVNITVDPAAVPLPPSLLLLAPGLLGLGVMRRFRKKS